MTEEQERFQRIADRCLRVGIVSLLVYALLHTLGAMVFWLAGGVAAAAFVLRFYYQRLANPPATSEPKWQQPAPADSNRPAAGNPEQVRKWLKFVPLMVIASIFVTVFWIIISRSSTDTMEESSPAEDPSGARNAVEENPNDADALLTLGNAFFNENQYDSARYYYERCLSVNPSYKEAHYNIALSWTNERNYSQAITRLQQCVQQNPEYGEALQLLGTCYYNQDQQSQALSFFQRAYDTGIRNAELSHYLGYLYDVQNNPTKALGFYKEALNQDSSKVEIYKRLAELEPEQSEWYLRKAKAWEGN